MASINKTMSMHAYNKNYIFDRFVYIVSFENINAFLTRGRNSVPQSAILINTAKKIKQYIIINNYNKKISLIQWRL